MEIAQWIDKLTVIFVIFVVLYVLLHLHYKSQEREDKLLDRLQARDLADYKEHQPEPEIEPTSWLGRRKFEKKQQQVQSHVKSKAEFLVRFDESARGEAGEYFDYQLEKGRKPEEIQANEILEEMTVTGADEKFMGGG